MSKKTSPLWDYFEEVEEDPSSVKCKVGDCDKKISRGKSGTPRSGLSNTGMRSHLKKFITRSGGIFLRKMIKGKMTKLPKRKKGMMQMKQNIWGHQSLT